MVISDADGPGIGVASTKAITPPLVNLICCSAACKQARNNFTGAAAQPGCRFTLIPDLLVVPRPRGAGTGSCEEIKNVFNMYIWVEGSICHRLWRAFNFRRFRIFMQKPIRGRDEACPMLWLTNITCFWRLHWKTRGTRKMLSQIEQVKARGGKVIASRNRWEMSKLQFFRPCVMVTGSSLAVKPRITASLCNYGYHIAAWRGLGCDQPRNLAKSVRLSDYCIEFSSLLMSWRKLNCFNLRSSSCYFGFGFWGFSPCRNADIPFLNLFLVGKFGCILDILTRKMIPARCNNQNVRSKKKTQASKGRRKMGLRKENIGVHHTASTRISVGPVFHKNLKNPPEYVVIMTNNPASITDERQTAIENPKRRLPHTQKDGPW